MLIDQRQRPTGKSAQDQVDTCDQDRSAVLMQAYVQDYACMRDLTLYDSERSASATPFAAPMRFRACARAGGAGAIKCF